MTLTSSEATVRVTQSRGPSSGYRQVPDSANALFQELAAMPAGHPARARLRDRTIEAWLPLARLLARRYGGRGEPAEDLLQTATIGLIKAIDRYDADRGADFAGFACPPSSARSAGTSATRPGRYGRRAASRSGDWPSPRRTRR